MRIPTQILLVVLLLAAVPVFGDVTLTLHHAGDGLGSLAEGTSTQHYTSTRMRSDYQLGKKAFSTIVDLDRERVVVLNHQKRTARIYPLTIFSEALQGLDDEGMEVSVTPLDERREIDGRTCQHYRADILIPSAGPPEDPDIDLITRSEWWATPETGGGDYERFWTAAAERGVFITHPAAASAQPAHTRAWSLLYREQAKSGLPCATESDLRFEGEGPLAKLLNLAGKITLRSTLDRISSDVIPGDLFEIPAGFKTK